MMEIKVLVDFSPSALAAITGLTNALSGGVVKELPAKQNDQMKAEKPKAETEKVTVPAGDAAITFEDLRKLSMEKAAISVAKKEEVKSLLTEFGVKAISALQKEQFADFHGKLTAL